MNIIKTILKLAAGLIIGASAGMIFVTLGIVIFTDMSFDTFLHKLATINISDGITGGAIGVLSAIIAVPLLVLIHEGGHLVCGLISGYRFVSFRIFNMTLIKDNGRLRIKRYAIAGTGGQCLLTPPDKPDDKVPVILYNSGGVLANLLALIAALAILLTVELKTFVHEFILIFIFIDIIFIIINGVPMKVGGISNDAMNVLSLSRNKLARRGFIMQLRANALIQEGIRPKDMPREWFIDTGAVNYKDALEFSMDMMRASRLLDMMQWEEAYRLFDEFYRHKSEIIPIYAKEVECELLFTSLVTGRIEQARELFTDELKKYITQYQSMMSSKPRVLCAVALFMEHDRAKALSIYEAVQRHSDDYLMQGEVLSDLDIMKTILNDNTAEDCVASLA
ncbi:hypothetical protein [uncultured Muribaculum sp.]|uniref:hypothetical protein n=1 Tax=uncultured Muribaculum sp. TaxID=1918613 RepID=UPI0025B6B7CB|nr:hypothetical protein [uncultured Muribaculum sp.]